MGWNPVTDIRGPQGVQGIQGVQGTQGIQGVKGDKGDTGAAGAPYSAAVTLTYASSITPNASSGLYQRCTATGNPTLNPPSNGQDGMRLWLRFVASGSTRTVTLASGIRRSTGVAATLEIPSGKRGDVGLFFDSGDGWTCMAASAQQ